MLRFRQFSELKEGKYPLWLRFTVGGLVVKIRNLSTQIQNEKDPQKQNNLISQQNSLISYISGLGIGVGSTDSVLLKRLKGSIGGKRNWTNLTEYRIYIIYSVLLTYWFTSKNKFTPNCLNYNWLYYITNIWFYTQFGGYYVFK